MKKVFSLIAVFVLAGGVVFGFAGCDKKGGTNDSSGNSGDENLTTQQILSFAADETINALSKGGGSFASKTGEEYTYFQYDENVYLAMNLIKEVSKISNIEDSKWYSSASIDNIVGNADKLYALKLSSSTANDVVTLNLIVKFSIEGLDISVNTKSYNLYNYVIAYNKETEAVSVQAIYEKSRDIENLEFGNYSVSNYYKVSYNNGLLITTEFRRNIDIENVENSALINNNSISNYNFLKFDAVTNNVVTEIESFDVENALKNSVINSVKEIMLTMKNVNGLISGVNSQEIQVDISLFKATDAVNISQLA